MKCNFQDCECRYQKQMTSQEFANDDKKSIYRIDRLLPAIFTVNGNVTVQTKSCTECELYDPHNRPTGGCLQSSGYIVAIILIIILFFLT